MHKTVYNFLFITLFWQAISISQTREFPFQFQGEELNYEMHYLNLRVANLMFHINENSENENQNICKLDLKAESKGTASFLFNIKNKYTCYFDKEKFLPIKIEKQINQKNIKHHFDIFFDYENRKIMANDSLKWEMPKNCFDYFSMLYFLRSVDYSSQDTLKFFLDSEYLISKVIAAKSGDNLELKIPAGSFNAFSVDVEFHQITKEERPWKTDLLTNRLAAPGSKLTIWLSDDELRLPLKIEYDRSIISTTILLHSYKEGKKD